MNYPPNIKKNDRVILFDGVCKLCNAWGNFIIKNDKNRIFKLCSVQSVEGQKILSYFNFSTEHFETMLYIDENIIYQKSDAFFKIISILGLPFTLAGIFKVLPRKLRNWLYDLIALNRYRLFGKYDYCQLPNEDHEQRYLCEK
ncbi:MAG: putative DCC family thiol-disulfide oxidoreductase YuxK [Kiritimatiellia bacterium]|jgi:predicted DCC family thiol-disulfide oxidoreductase YuxK